MTGRNDNCELLCHLPENPCNQESAESSLVEESLKMCSSCETSVGAVSNNFFQIQSHGQGILIIINSLYAQNAPCSFLSFCRTSVSMHFAKKRERISSFLGVVGKNMCRNDGMRNFNI